jgi:hypothetical protein
MTWSLRSERDGVVGPGLGGPDGSEFLAIIATTSATVALLTTSAADSLMPARFAMPASCMDDIESIPNAASCEDG